MKKKTSNPTYVAIMSAYLLGIALMASLGIWVMLEIIDLMTKHASTRMSWVEGTGLLFMIVFMGIMGTSAVGTLVTTANFMLHPASSATLWILFCIVLLPTVGIILYPGVILMELSSKKWRQLKDMGKYGKADGLKLLVILAVESVTKTTIRHRSDD